MILYVHTTCILLGVAVQMYIVPVYTYECICVHIYIGPAVEVVRLTLEGSKGLNGEHPSSDG